MIKILFDHQIFSEQQYGGISRYFANLYKGINDTKEAKVTIGVRYVKNHYIKLCSQSYNNLVGRWFLRHTVKRYKWNRKYSISLLKNSNYDVFHATYYDNYSLKLNTKPLVITIHDMIHENNPDMFADSSVIINQKKEMMMSANAIIAISNFTKSEILRFYPKFEKKVTVVYHGSSPLTIGHIDSIPLPTDFILFVGERKNYKNFDIMAKALAPIFKQNQAFSLVCAGGKEFDSEECDLLSDLGILPQCQQVNVDDLRLNQLYQKALVFVYPSSQEGFGLPILEAFQNSCAVACSDKSCLPEIGGDAVQYFDPTDEHSILNAVSTVIFNKTNAEALKAKGKERLSLFTIEDCVKNTIDVYKRIC